MTLRSKKRGRAPLDKRRVIDIMNERFGSFETNRIFKIFEDKIDERHEFNFDEFMNMIHRVLDYDFNDVIEQSFAKLDIANEGSISVKNMRQGVLVNLKRHETPSVHKTLNRLMYKRIESRSSKEKLNKDDIINLVKEICDNEAASNIDSSS